MTTSATSSPAAPSAASPLLGFGQVRHVRLWPERHAFSYGTYFLMLPMRTLSTQMDPLTKVANVRPSTNGLAINQRGWLSFHDIDHGDGRQPARGGALAWVDELLRDNGIHNATGEVWLHTYPRVLGFTFKPVSFWYCHRASDDQGGALRAIVVEVNNTFGERHCYLLDEPRFGVEQQANKVFHVSPFNAVVGHYRFRFMRCMSGNAAAERTVARVDYFQPSDDDTCIQVMHTSISGRLYPVTPATVRHALWRYPAMTLGVVLHIHTQAFRLWRKKVPFFRKPQPPQSFVTR